jgi:Leucine-rich repeat (LRR) protein
LVFDTDLKKIKEIKANGNEIAELTDFSKFKNLNKLNLSDNRISKFKVDKYASNIK